MLLKLINIIEKYKNDDVNEIVLKKKKNQDFVNISEKDFNFILNQIACRQKYNEKFPIVIKDKQWTFPNVLSVEQASSELAAYYKSNIIEEYNSSIDLTGGLGIDSIYLYKKSKKHTYCEIDDYLYNTFTHNCKSLKLKSIKCFNSTAEDFIKSPDKYYDVLYIDPSRRNDKLSLANSKPLSKVYLLEHLLPNILPLQKYFPKVASKSIIKLSPMLDINVVIEKINNISEIHIVSIDNDCKELLVVCDYKNGTDIDNIMFVGTNFICDYKQINNDIKSIIKNQQILEYRLTNSNKMQYAASVDKYLFEPNASIMKLSCWNILCSNFNISKLHPNSHLFTAENKDKEKKKFPGNIYEVVDIVNYDKKKILETIDKESKVSIKCRNFPDNPEEVQKTLKLKDGNDYYLFCTTLIDNSLKVIITNKI